MSGPRSVYWLLGVQETMNLLAQITWWFSAITGWDHTLIFSLPAEALIVRDGQTECAVASGSEQHAKLSAWLSANGKGWEATPASYVPALVVSGTGFSINFLKGGAILNYNEGQYSHSADPSQYEFLHCANHTQQGAQADRPASGGSSA